MCRVETYNCQEVLQTFVKICSMNSCGISKLTTAIIIIIDFYWLQSNALTYRACLDVLNNDKTNKQTKLTVHEGKGGGGFREQFAV